MRPLPLLAILLLLAGCVGQGNGARDTDGDGLPDDQETTPHAISIAYANGTVESRAVTSDPHRQDTDGDGLSDVDEFAFKTDPRSVDTDRDGLLDGHNVTLPAGSDQAKAWRALGVLEVPAGSGKFVGEMDATRECTLSAARGSSELLSPDALSDGAEVAGWNVTVRGFSFPVTSDPCVADTDRDGLPDDKEMALGTDPRNPDTDGDGVVDGFDADPLWNLGLALENVTASGNATVSFQAGAQAVEVPSHGNRTATLDVNDSATDRSTLPVTLVVGARDSEGSHSVDLFGDPRGTYLTVDLVQGTTALLNAPAQATHHVETRGPDGTLSFDWRVARS